jgi:hypothetical protein
MEADVQVERSFSSRNIFTVSPCCCLYHLEKKEKVSSEHERCDNEGGGKGQVPAQRQCDHNSTRQQQQQQQQQVS